MNKRWLELSVGLMMVAGVAALVALALQVSGGNMSRNAQSYAISALFENAAGLGPKAKVTMAGVTVGEVVSVAIDPNALMAVVNMEIYGQVDYLSIDSSASILTAGLLGEKYVGLTVGAEEEVLVDGDVIEDTQSALVLEELIGQFLLNFGDN
ncbi:MAG: outer membrane lipid asymmetry maintenance protein MlaD [Pseudomonadales bacterium]|jgi:phospholipid/cholesterol/gamma-HCH transport system substrate-binding protein|nr:outer membrane lipid asymmetry maintenance protein MlaD [Pseudomonadales bacterium]|tara:strand:+ start:1430 stop:1888 length:459 start_codon:yes stop_codon:yes gene_type:complete